MQRRYYHLEVPSDRNPDEMYHVTISTDLSFYWNCDCRSFQFPGRGKQRGSPCKHIARVREALKLTSGLEETDRMVHPHFLRLRQAARKEEETYRPAVMQHAIGANPFREPLDW